MDERKALHHHINNLQHSWIIAPRRYGKTSLCSQILQELSKKQGRFLTTLMNFTVAEDARAVESLIKDRIAQLISQLLTPTKKSLLVIKKLFKAFKPEIVIDSDGNAKFKLLSANSNPAQSIIDMLLEIDEYASNEKKTLVIVFDEFQHLATIKGSEHIEASIRHAAERVKARPLL